MFSECIHAANTLKVVCILAYFNCTSYVKHKGYLAFIVYSGRILDINIGKMDGIIKVKIEFSCLKQTKTKPLLPPRSTGFQILPIGSSAQQSYTLLPAKTRPEFLLGAVVR